MAQVVIYTTRLCGYCVAAKRLLDRLGHGYQEIPVDQRADLRRWLLEATGRHTVPQIFIDDESIGGYTDLAELVETGELEQLVDRGPGQP
jgi:glutaredoxin 3